MKKLLCILGFFIGISAALNAQWVVSNTGSAADLYAVHYFSPTNIYIGGIDHSSSTADGGATWNITSLSSLGLFIYDIEDIYYTSTTNGFSTGLFDGGNTEIILKTTTTGSFWSNAVASTAPPLIRKTTAIDRNGVRLITVGNAGRIYRSITTGTSWSLVTSGTTAALHDVKFASFDTIYVCGASRLLKSYNGGTTWTSLSVSGTYTGIACNHNVVYAIANASNVMRKSTNSGVTYSTITLPFTAGYAIHAISKDTVLVSANDGIYITRDGGVGWEKFILSSYSPVRKFDFLNSSNGIAVGDADYVLRTSNLNMAPSLPVSVFTIPGPALHCLNDSITLVNGTSPGAGYTYQWQMDGVTFSTAYNTGKKLTVAGSHTISLITSNTFGSDTSNINITVTGYGILPMVISAPDTICTSIVGFSLANSQTGVSYQLRKGTVNVGAAKVGTGGTLEFSTVTAVSVSSTYNIKATNTNPCFVDTLTQYIPLIVTTGVGIPAGICTPTSSLCTIAGYDPGIKNFSLGTINNTSTYTINKYTNYACCEHTNLVLGSVYPISITIAHPLGEKVKVWIDYNGNNTFETTEAVFTGTANPTLTGNITIPSSVLNTKLRMRVASDYDNTALDNACTDYNCGEIEDYTVMVVPAPVPPTPNFTYTTSITCSTTVTFTNTSYNALTYVWDFGDGSPTSTATNPSHVFSASGTYNVALTATNPYGSNVFTFPLVITNPTVPVTPTCLPTLDVCSGMPKIVGLAIYAIDGYTTHSFSTLVQDYTCTAQYKLYSDTSYYFFVSGTGPDNNFIGLLDKTNDGTFTTGSECLTASCNYLVDVGCTGSGGPATDFVTMTLPADAPDSTALRMRLFVRDAGSFASPTYCELFCGDYKDVTVFLTHRPIDAQFTAVPLSSCAATGLVTATFNNKSRSDVSWLWDFGDGVTSASKNPSHAYSFGSYTVKLKAWDMDGNMDSLVMPNYINVFPVSGTAVINATGYVLSTTIPATSYQWNLNGIPIAGATSSVYVAAAGGNYTVTLTGGTCVFTSGVYHMDYVVADFHADTTAYCNVDSASVDFINTSIDATSFNWDFGDGSSISTLVSPIHTYNFPGIFTVTLIACDTICDTMQLINYITVDSSLFSADLLSGLPDIFCEGDSVTLAGTISPGVIYQWLNSGSSIVGTNNDTLTVSSTGIYSYVISNALGCSDTSGTINVWKDTACVWPGDADRSFLVDNFDILPIGIFYGQTGISRSVFSNSWDAYPVMDWGVLQTSGEDIKHVDCNGDGTINDSDTLAINLNYTLLHTLPPTLVSVRSADPDLYCVSSSSSYIADTWVDIDVMAGSAVETVTNLYGLGFSLDYDNSVVEPGTESMIFANSWLTDFAIDGLSFARIDASAGIVKTGLTRISHTPKSGYGKLATFRFKVKSTLSSSIFANFFVSYYQANDELGNPLNFDSGIPYSVSFGPDVTGLFEGDIDNSIQIYPNPYSSQATMEYNLITDSKVKIEILNSLGECVSTLQNGHQPAGKYRLLLDDKIIPTNGVYIVSYSVNGITLHQNLIKSN